MAGVIADDRQAQRSSETMQLISQAEKKSDPSAWAVEAVGGGTLQQPETTRQLQPPRPVDCRAAGLQLEMVGGDPA